MNQTLTRGAIVAGREVPADGSIRVITITSQVISRIVPFAIQNKHAGMIKHDFLAMSRACSRSDLINTDISMYATRYAYLRQKKLYDHICINFCGRYDHEASDAQKLMVVKKTQYSS